MRKREWYFYHYEVKVTDPILRGAVIERLKEIAYLDGEPKPMEKDPSMISVRFKVDNVQQAKEKTAELETNFAGSEIKEHPGYMADKSTQERAIQKEKADKRKSSLISATSVYLITMFGGGTLSGFFNQVTLNTPPQAWLDTFFQASMVAIPAFIVVYLKKKPNE